MDAAGLGRFICLQGADLCYSSFARNQTGLCGFGYIARTGDLARLARLGVVPSARRTGIARGLLLHLLEEARARRDRMMVLEMIEQNPRIFPQRSAVAGLKIYGNMYTGICVYANDGRFTARAGHGPETPGSRRRDFV
ncbi:MAG: GNAT family N-acetyltransferase [Verrucomicrobiota bacterium]|nr:GNAT family N-acetyltransferase [Chthoniobacterales bacterium]MDQ3414051.1 GNAT family N-acetyltransferase [Verrucomicrobiota bacterium]